MLLLALLLSLCSGYTLLEQTYAGLSCAGSPWQIALVGPTAGPCPVPSRQCYPSPLNASLSMSIECTSFTGITFPFPSGFVAEFTFEGAGCQGNSTATVGFVANQCISPGSNARVKFDCNADTITSCQGAADCSGASCNTAPMPQGCVASGAYSALLKCVK